MPEISKSKLRLVKILMILQEHSSPKNVLTTKKISDYLVAEGLEQPSKNTIGSDMAVLQVADPHIKDNNGMGWYYQHDVYEDDKGKPTHAFIFNMYHYLYLVQAITNCLDMNAKAKKELTNVIQRMTYASKNSPDKLVHTVNVFLEALQKNKYMEFTYLYTLDFHEDENGAIERRYKRVTTLLTEGRTNNKRYTERGESNDDEDDDDYIFEIDSDKPVEDIPEEIPVKFKVLPQAVRIVDDKLYMKGYLDVNTCIFFSFSLMQDVKLGSKAPFDRHDIAEKTLEGEIVEDITAIDQYVLNSIGANFSLDGKRFEKIVRKLADRQNIVLHCHISFVMILRQKYRYHNVNFFVLDDIEDATCCEVHIVNIPFNNYFARLVARYSHLINHEEYMAIMSMFRIKQQSILNGYHDKNNKLKPTKIDWAGIDSSPNLKAPPIDETLERIKKGKSLVYGKDFDIGPVEKLEKKFSK